MKPFSDLHLIYLGVTVCFAVLYCVPTKLHFSDKSHARMKWPLFWILLLNEFWWFLFRHFELQVPLKNNLPLHLCDMAIFLTLFAIAFEKKWLSEAAYYIALSSGLLGVLYPNISEKGDLLFIATLRYFITHIILLVAGLYFTVGRNFCPSYNSVLRCFAFIHVFGLSVAVINSFLDTNYFYVCQKPANPSFLPDLPLPLHALALSGLYVIVLHVLFAPLWVWGRVRGITRET